MGIENGENGLKDLVSVIMPAYNSEAFISEAIESVIGQTYSNWELIVVDDGSTDNTSQILAGYKEADNRIRYFYQKNSGPAAARNKGIKESRGKYIAFLDSDDIWYLDKLEKQMKFLISHPGYVVYGGRNYILEENGKFIESGQIRFFENHDTVQKNAKYFIFHPNMTITSTVLFEKDLLDKVGYFDETPQICEDDNLFIRMALQSKFHCLNEAVDYRRKHDNSLTGSGKAWGKGPFRYRSIQRALEQTPETLLPWKKTDILSRWSLIYSIGAFENNRYLTSFLWFLRGFWVSPSYSIRYFREKFAKKIWN